MKLKILYYEKFWIIVSIIIMISIFIQSNYPSAINVPNFYNFQFDKIIHIIAWFGLSFSLRLGTNQHFRISESNKRVILILILFCITYGLIDEIHQYFIPSRSSDIFDVIADSIGSLLGVSIAHVLIITQKDLNF